MNPTDSRTLPAGLLGKKVRVNTLSCFTVSFKYLNVPILVGLTKNSFLGEALRGKMKKTHISSITANTMAIINGANIIRVDDVEQAVTMVNIIDAISNNHKVLVFTNYINVKENLEDELGGTSKNPKVKWKDVHISTDEMLERQKDCLAFEFENIWEGLKVINSKIEAI